MNQMGPPKSSIRPAPDYKTSPVTNSISWRISQIPCNWNGNTKICFEYRELPFSGAFPSNMKYDPESYLFSANDFRLVSGTFKEQENII